jgi:tetratricopeptide (TPR) repeat protein
MLRGTRDRDLERYDEAIYYYERIIEIDSESVIPVYDWIFDRRKLRQRSFPYNNWGAVLYRKKDYKGAITLNQRSIELNPSNAPALINLANAFLQLKEYESASDNFQRGTELDPKNARAFYRWGDALYAMSDYEGAIDKYRRSIDLDSNNRAAVSKLDEALDKKGLAAAVDPTRRSP